MTKKISFFKKYLEKISDDTYMIHNDTYNDTYASQKTPKKFNCELCLYGCSKKSDWNRHIITTKHKNATQMIHIGVKNAQRVATPKPINNVCNDSKYHCLCGNKYKQHSNYYRHRKNCYIFQNIKNENEKLLEENENLHTDVINYNKSSEGDFKELIVLLLKENKEFQKNFLELIPQIKGHADHSYNTTNTNSNNTNNFNIQMFLNEHCKNAMNLTEFIESLPITNETYNHTIENGLTKTITHMITDGLSNIDILQRPIHCTDAARKTMYVKENNVWEKDTELNNVLYGIKKIALKQRTMINKWQDANCGWDLDDNLQTKMTNLVCNSMTLIEQDQRETNKIIKAIGKNTYLTNEIKHEYK